MFVFNILSNMFCIIYYLILIGWLMQNHDIFLEF